LGVVFEAVSDLDSLAKTVLQIDDKVGDYLGVAVILEVLGITDGIAQRYGFVDRFSLAKKLIEIIDYYRGRGETVESREAKLAEQIREALKLYIHGILYGSPWLLMTLALLSTEVALWSIRGATIMFATMVGLATFLSLIVSSAVQPVFVRKMLFYLHQAMYKLVVRVVEIYFAVGLLVVASASLLLYYLNFFLRLYPMEWFSLFILYFTALSMLWLAIAPLYAFRKYVILVAIFAGIIILNNFLVKSLGSSLSPFQPYGLYFAILASAVYTFTYLYLKEKALERYKPEYNDLKVKLPRLSFMVLPGLPYALAGALYFILLFMDRLVVWSMSPSAYPLWFNLDYEVGANLALLMLIPVFGALNHSVLSLYREIVESGEHVEARHVKLYRLRVRDRYFACLRSITASSLISLAVLYFLLLQQPQPFFGLIPVSRQSLFVFILAGLGNFFIAIFLANSMLHNYLYKPGISILTLAAAIAGNLLVGFTLSRLYGFEYAAFGYLAGCLLAALLSTIFTFKLISRIDYTYYTAF